ncbi:MAG: hypothetical protein MZV65_13930 [Chromatiales bacterium]|nr:hypothetical protein [Chromatiales bacterium]
MAEYLKSIPPNSSLRTGKPAARPDARARGQPRCTWTTAAAATRPAGAACPACSRRWPATRS